MISTAVNDVFIFMYKDIRKDGPFSFADQLLCEIFYFHVMASNKSFFETVLDVLAGIDIIASPLLISAIPAGIVWFTTEGWVKAIVPILLLFIGLIIGIRWSLRLARGEGTFTYMNRINRSPELDKVTDADLEQTDRRKKIEKEG